MREKHKSRSKGSSEKTVSLKPNIFKKKNDGCEKRGHNLRDGMLCKKTKKKEGKRIDETSEQDLFF
jgi:hypothetical protein